MSGIQTNIAYVDTSRSYPTQRKYNEWCPCYARVHAVARSEFKMQIRQLKALHLLRI